MPELPPLIYIGFLQRMVNYTLMIQGKYYPKGINHHA